MRKILICGWFTDSLNVHFPLLCQIPSRWMFPKKAQWSDRFFEFCRTRIQIPSRQNLGYVPRMRHRKQLVYIFSSLSNPQLTFLHKKCWNMFHQSQEHAHNVPNVYLDPLKRTSRGGVENLSQAQWDAMSPLKNTWLTGKSPLGIARLCIYIYIYAYVNVRVSTATFIYRRRTCFKPIFGFSEPPFSKVAATKTSRDDLWGMMTLKSHRAKSADVTQPPRQEMGRMLCNQYKTRGSTKSMWFPN